MEAGAALACPACSYDLRGASEADPIVCPECGGVFTREDIARHGESRQRVRISRWWLLALGGVFGFWLLSVPRVSSCGAGLLMWPVALLWGVSARSAPDAKPWPALVVGVVVSFIAVVPGNRGLGNTALEIAIINGVPLFVWAALWASPPRPVYSASFAMLAMITGVPSVAILTSGSVAYALGNYWTNWDSSLPELTGRWELGRDHAMGEGLVLLGPTLLALGAAAAVYIWGKRVTKRRAASA